MFNDRIWSTKNRNKNVVIIWMDFKDNILDIEGYDVEDFEPQPYPTKMFVVRADDHNQTFIFASSRSNSEADKQGGLYIS